MRNSVHLPATVMDTAIQALQDHFDAMVDSDSDDARDYMQIVRLAENVIYLARLKTEGEREWLRGKS